MKPKKDTSQHVVQKDKLKGQLNLKPLNWTPRQKEFLELALNKKTRIIFVNGPAGSTKTIMSVYAGLEMINQKKISDMMYLRSAVESSDSGLGFLPGDVDQKISLYGIPLSDKLEELLGYSDIQILQKEERIQIMPVNFVRGQSWNARLAIVDEAQNMTEEEIFTILTRIGKFSKGFILADPTQSDLKNKNKTGAFKRLAQYFTNAKGQEGGIHYFEFQKQDIMRDDLTKLLVELREDMINAEKQT